MQEVYVINTSSCNPVVCNPVTSPHMKYILRRQILYRQHNLPQSVIIGEKQAALSRIWTHNALCPRRMFYQLSYWGSSQLAGPNHLYKPSQLSYKYAIYRTMSAPNLCIMCHLNKICDAFGADLPFREASISASSWWTSLVLALRSFDNVFSAFSVLCFLANHLKKGIRDCEWK